MISEKKQGLIKACRQYVEERISRLNVAIADLEDALKLETKCSAGDKYETGRAMLHLEFEKLSEQLQQYARLQKTVRLIDQLPISSVVGFGNVVETSGSNYIIAIPAGKFKVKGKEYYAVGVNSPIAHAMSGKKEGDNFIFNGTDIKITAVF